MRISLIFPIIMYFPYRTLELTIPLILISVYLCINFHEVWNAKIENTKWQIYITCYIFHLRVWLWKVCIVHIQTFQSNTLRWKMVYEQVVYICHFVFSVLVIFRKSTVPYFLNDWMKPVYISQTVHFSTVP